MPKHQDFSNTYNGPFAGPPRSLQEIVAVKDTTSQQDMIDVPAGMVFEWIIVGLGLIAEELIRLDRNTHGDGR